MKVLDRKLLRDLVRLRGQVLAIALVMATGVATLVLGVGTYRSLEETRNAYYERHRFADIFASVARAPERLLAEITEIPGILAAETRIRKMAQIDIEGMSEPATGLLVSLPEFGSDLLNLLYLRRGRLPDPSHHGEVVVNEAFAEAHGFAPGSAFDAVLNGRMRKLTIVGVALSPEFIYALGPGVLIPDDRRFGIVWMARTSLASAFDLEGAFSDVAVKLQHGAREEEVIDRLDRLLKRYGSRGAFPRTEQQSHAFLEAELQQLAAMSWILPPIFLGVAAFLVNITLSRMVALEREQIGLMKAVGYANAGVAWHYLKFVAAIAFVGIGMGTALGIWLGRGMTRLYSEFYHFPFLVFDTSTDTFAIAGGATIAAVAIGAFRAVRGVASLQPSVAMRPPAPISYRKFARSPPAFFPKMSPLAIMVARNIVRWPFRAAFTTIGLAFAVAMMIGTTFALDSIEEMIDLAFFRSERQDATIEFAGRRGADALQEAARLPGVLVAEPVRTMAATIRHGHHQRRIAVIGIPRDGSLSRIIDLAGDTVALPRSGIVISEALAGRIGARVGDIVELDPSEIADRPADVPVAAVVRGYLGLASYMEIEALNRLMREGASTTGANILLDRAQADRFFDAVKKAPQVAGLSLQFAALQGFRDTLAENMTIMLSVYIAFASIVAFGVVYNSARIQLSERARELASLRVIGFTRAEASFVLLGELALLTLIAQPLGWGIGYGLAFATVAGFDTDLFRIPLVVERATYGLASAVVLGAAVVSALIVRHRVDRLDLVQVLKTRE